jgi:hypothetical protein
VFRQKFFVKDLPGARGNTNHCLGSRVSVILPSGFVGRSKSSANLLLLEEKLKNRQTENKLDILSRSPLECTFNKKMSFASGAHPQKPSSVSGQTSGWLSAIAGTVT